MLSLELSAVCSRVVRLQCWSLLFVFVRACLGHPVQAHFGKKGSFLRTSEDHDRLTDPKLIRNGRRWPRDCNLVSLADPSDHHSASFSLSFLLCSHRLLLHAPLPTPSIKHFNMSARPQNVGIKAIEIYFPRRVSVPRVIPLLLLDATAAARTVMLSLLSIPSRPLAGMVPALSLARIRSPLTPSP